MNARPSASRPLRSDAERNRLSILCAAGRVFAEQGPDVTLERIAEVAGVGVGTIYRRFTSVGELMEVVLQAKVAEYADRAEGAAIRAQDEPWEAFRDYVLFALEQQATDLAFGELILRPAATTQIVAAEISRALAATILLTDRAKAARVIHADFHHSDLYLLLVANAGIVRMRGRAEPDSWRRIGRFALRAFRAVDPVDLP